MDNDTFIVNEHNISHDCRFVIKEVLTNMRLEDAYDLFNQKVDYTLLCKLCAENFQEAKNKPEAPPVEKKIKQVFPTEDWNSVCNIMKGIIPNFT